LQVRAVLRPQDKNTMVAFWKIEHNKHKKKGQIFFFFISKSMLYDKYSIQNITL